MINSNGDEWITPEDAHKEMSRRAGYVVTVDDIRQLRRTGKIKHVKRLTRQITLYSLDEIRTVTPPKKRKPVPFIEDEDTAKRPAVKPDQEAA